MTTCDRPFPGHPRWINRFRDRGSILRVDTIPLDDLLPHRTHKCACKPKVETLRSGSGRPSFLVIHHAHDARETAEKHGPA